MLQILLSRNFPRTILTNANGTLPQYFWKIFGPISADTQSASVSERITDTHMTNCDSKFITTSLVHADIVYRKHFITTVN